MGVNAQPSAVELPAIDLTVDVFITAWNEDFDLIVGCLAAACSMKGDFQVWLLDDGDDPDLAKIAKKFGAGYLNRVGNADAKAGNMNAALPLTKGDIIVIFDVDHLPEASFLEKTLPYFADQSVGFVQAIPTFYNNYDFGWVSRAAAETTFDFYTSTSRGMDGFNSVTKIGTNSLIRREALLQIGNYKPGLAEDLATSIELHAAGWTSRYVHEPLAPGLAPRDLTAWYIQQFKWARGVFEVLISKYPRLFFELNFKQRIVYAVRTTKYLLGTVIGIHIALLISILLGADYQTKMLFQTYFLYLAPLAVTDVLIRGAALNKWGGLLQTSKSLWRATILVFNTWPIYMLALGMSLFRLPLDFQPTPKSSSNQLHPKWVLVQLGTAILLVLGLLYNLISTDKNFDFLILYSVTLLFSIPQLGLIRPLARPYFFATETMIDHESILRSSLGD
ncbi:MAG: glycosyltransferase [Anaerolineae bacterium]